MNFVIRLDDSRMGIANFSAKTSVLSESTVDIGAIVVPVSCMAACHDHPYIAGWQCA